MYVSIRDDTLLATGFDDIAQGIGFYGFGGVELSVNREHRVHALTSPGAEPYLYLDKDDDIARLGDQSAQTGVRIAGFMLPNNFNADDIEKELAWIVRVVEVAARLGVPAVR